MPIEREEFPRRFSLPLLFSSWIVATVGLVLLALGVWSVLLHGGLRDFLQQDRSARTELEWIGGYGLTFSISGLIVLVVATVLIVFAFRARKR